jgi:hypothetical protein
MASFGKKSPSLAMYNLLPMKKSIPRLNLLGAVLSSALLCTVFSWSVCAQSQVDQELDGRKRLFPEAGPGTTGLKRGPGGKYYVLESHSVLVFDADGKKLSEFPPPGTKGPSAILYGEALDVDSDGRVYVADRGRNILRVYSPAGDTLLTVSFDAPTGIVALSGGEFAATSSTSQHLLTIFNLKGEERRSFGDLIDTFDDEKFNRSVNIGRLNTDTAGNIYFLFKYLPEPTFRRYDRIGYAAEDISLTTLEFAPAAQARRREIKRQIDHGQTPELRASVSCMAIDPDTQRIWLALDNELILLDPDGIIRAEYRAYTPSGARLAPNSILVEPDRLLLTADPLGVYEFPRPDKDLKSAKPVPKQQ